jgi:hypothetical protein
MTLERNEMRASTRRLIRAWGIASVLLLGAAPALTAQTIHAAEYQVKAVFLFNVAQFVEWPPQAFPDSVAPVVIGVLGNDPFGAFLDETVRGEQLGGRALEIRRYRRVEDLSDCQILFISQSERDRMNEIRARLRTQPILIVSDVDGFAEGGGMMGLFTDRKRVRIRINLQAVQAAGLTISSKLLRVADVVTPAER